MFRQGECCERAKENEEEKRPRNIGIRMFAGTRDTWFQWSRRGGNLVAVCVEVDTGGKLGFNPGFLLRGCCMISGVREVHAGLLKSQL